MELRPASTSPWEFFQCCLKRHEQGYSSVILRQGQARVRAYPSMRLGAFPCVFPACLDEPWCRTWVQSHGCVRRTKYGVIRPSVRRVVALLCSGYRVQAARPPPAQAVHPAILRGDSDDIPVLHSLGKLHQVAVPLPANPWWFHALYR